MRKAMRAIGRAYTRWCYYFWIIWTLGFGTFDALTGQMWSTLVNALFFCFWAHLLATKRLREDRDAWRERALRALNAGEMLHNLFIGRRP